MHAQIAQNLSHGEVAAFASALAGDASAPATYGEESDLRDRIAQHVLAPSVLALAGAAMAASSEGPEGWSGQLTVRETAESLERLAWTVSRPQATRADWDAALNILDVLPPGTGRGAVHALLTDAQISQFAVWDRMRQAASRHAPAEGDAEAAALLARALKDAGRGRRPELQAAGDTLIAEAAAGMLLPNEAWQIHAMPVAGLKEHVRGWLTHILEVVFRATGEAAWDIDHPWWQDGITAAIDRVTDRILGDHHLAQPQPPRQVHIVVVNALLREVHHQWRLMMSLDRMSSLLDEAKTAPRDQLKHRLQPLPLALTPPLAKPFAALIGDIARAGRSLPESDQVALLESLCLPAMERHSSDFVTAAEQEILSAIPTAAPGAPQSASHRAAKLVPLLARVRREPIQEVMASTLGNEHDDASLAGLSDLLLAVESHGRLEDFQHCVGGVIDWLKSNEASAPKVERIMGLLLEQAGASYSIETHGGLAIVANLVSLLRPDPPGPYRPLLASALAQATSGLSVQRRVRSLISLAETAFDPKQLGNERARTDLMCAVAAQRHTLAPAQRDALTAMLLQDYGMMQATRAMRQTLLLALDSTPEVELRVALHEPVAERDARRKEWLAETRASGPSDP